MLKLIFGWINFVIFLGLLYWFYRRNLQSQITKGIHTGQSHTLKLETTASDLENRVREVAVDHILQTQQIALLLDRAACWRRSFQSLLIAEKDLFAQRTAHLLDQDSNRLRNLSCQVSDHLLLKSVLQQTEIELKKQFANRELAQHFLDRAVEQFGSVRRI